MKPRTAKTVLRPSTRSAIMRCITRYQLRFASERDLLPVLSASVIGEGYTEVIHRFLPFSYSAVAAVCFNGRTRFFMNEQDVARHTGRLLRRLGQRRFLQQVLRPARRAGLSAARSILRQREQVILHPELVVRHILDAYPVFMAAIGVYNCLNRVTVVQGTLPFSGSVIARIGTQRDTLGAQYPRIEELLTRALAELGRRHHVDGGLLRFMTKKELLAWLAHGQQLSGADRTMLRSRKNLSLALFAAQPFVEQVIADKPFIVSLERRLSQHKRTMTKLHGQTAYPGYARGRVVVMQGNQKQSSSAGILVTSMTHPKDTARIRGCRAIVTDEGGVLSHAAVLAREFRIPCVIGTKIATQVFRDGEMIEVDADKSIVHKIEQRRKSR